MRDTTVSLVKVTGRTYGPGDRVETYAANTGAWLPGKVQDWTLPYGSTWVTLDCDPGGWSRPFGLDHIRPVR